ncbi:hypothetical protein [Hymenobacter sp. PAMC 26628]|uniref:hypothetical protein n=1 Tax=Hymenobacter sp. PAMC 26628 TaxID=1484118 RepID=UPI00194E3F02|nr:hypothetical protein [Hymenobacter sp. PAMC 26628]
MAFGLTTGLAVWLFYRATRRSQRSLLVVLAWLLLLQGAVARSGFYANTAAGQPRLALLLGPPLLAIAGLFATAGGRRFLDGLRLETLTLLHVVRVPVELVLPGLFLHKAVPQLMTFEGPNWDVLAGLTAPIVYYLAFVAKRLGPRGLLAWNVVCLGSLLNIVVTAVLSAPSPIQRFAFEQPNVAILHFPFVFLPGCAVPLVLLAHLATIRQLVAPKSLITAAF